MELDIKRKRNAKIFLKYQFETELYYPYGEEITSKTQNTLNHKFTGHERDFESNLAQLTQNFKNLEVLT